MKRYRSVTAKAGELRAAYGRAMRGESPDLLYAWGANGAGKPDARVLMTALESAPVYDGKCLRVVLEERGYDITTLKFSVSLKVA